ncbi:P63C domain-containing protein [Microbacterium sp. cx-59]|uniref:P63C domain-containing protein n=1 Tax=Microbacterium sp. cx-59 TaxID=2891207 RepID=UPI001E52326D|nr:P63C domain-containing protein [Microbacterium sp. cx-59]MCC4907319.1 P63C domain-containing protein [Microbacterium sp. cx-59]
MNELEEPEEDSPTLFDASEGGRARARKLSPERRREIAQRAAESRWDSTIPRAAYTGAIVIGDRRIECAVLPDGTRVLSQGTVMAALDRATRSGVRRSDAPRRAPFLSANNLDEFIPDGLSTDLEPIRYRLPNQQFISTGYRAETLPKVLEVYLSARQAGKLQESQQGAAQAAEMLMRALAQVGITALVDEATGYQEVRARDELQQLLSKYVTETFRRWVSVFPNEFFRELYRLYGWDYKEGKTKHPQYIGKFINEHIYKQLPEGVHAELERLNPRGASGHRSRKHHQHLTVDTGIEHLDKQIVTVVTLLQVSEDIDQFRSLFDRRFPAAPNRQVLRVTETAEQGFLTDFIDDWLDEDKNN